MNEDLQIEPEKKIGRILKENGKMLSPKSQSAKKLSPGKDAGAYSAPFKLQPFDAQAGAQDNHASGIFRSTLDNFDLLADSPEPKQASLIDFPSFMATTNITMQQSKSATRIFSKKILIRHAKNPGDHAKDAKLLDEKQGKAFAEVQGRKYQLQDRVPSLKTPKKSRKDSHQSVLSLSPLKDKIDAELLKCSHTSPLQQQLPPNKEQRIN